MIKNSLIAAFMPHGHCFLWQSDLLWLHVISDALIGLAYLSIPVALVRLVQRRDDLQFDGVVRMFAAFIFLCGTSHLVEIYTMWVPQYWLEGIVKALTALVSVGTAVMLWPLIPKAVAIPSRNELEREIEERQQVQEELEELNRQLEKKVERRTKELEDLARTDPLTGLFNRRYLKEQLADEIERSRRFGSPMTVVLADLDNFGVLNDEYGHIYGDAVLEKVGEVLDDSTREVDVPARLGGDEFAIILPGTDREGAERLSARLRDQIITVDLPEPGDSARDDAPQIADDKRIGVSIGIAAWSEDVDDVDELLRRADEAMYGAKKAGLAQSSWNDSRESDA